MLGRQLILAFGRAVVASSVTCEVDMQTDTIEVASPTSGVFRDYIASLCGWSISTSGLIKTTQQQYDLFGLQYDLFELWRNRIRLRVNYYDTEMRMVRSGYAIITNLRESAPNRSIPTYSISLQGCGALTTIDYTAANLSSRENFQADAHIAFAADGNTAKSTPNNHYFEYMQSGQMFSAVLSWPNTLTRLKLNYYSGTPEQQPMVIIIRHKASDWTNVKNTIKSLDTLNFVKQYEVAHLGGKFQNGTTYIELLLTPGYVYRVITDSDMALDYISNIKTLNLPTS